MRFPGNIDQARQGWGCVLGLRSPEREGSEGSGMKSKKRVVRMWWHVESGFCLIPTGALGQGVYPT